MIRMMNSDDNFVGPVNLGNPNEFTMLQLAKTILEITGSNQNLFTCQCLRMIQSNVNLVLTWLMKNYHVGRLKLN